VDLDGDGRRDLLSGSRPGAIHLFRATEAGGFERGRKIVDATGAVLRAGRSSTVHVVDWERDGDLDLVLGSCEGWVWLVRNASGDGRLRLGKPERLPAEGQAIRAPGRDSGPTVADWDGDGRHDLLVGCGDGRVLLYRNEARSGEPTFARPVTLVPPASGDLSRRPGRCVKLAVADWNGDGRLDLLVGDRRRERVEPPKLTREETAQRAALRQSRVEFQAYLDAFDRERLPGLESRVRRAMGIDPETPLGDLPGDTRREVASRTEDVLRSRPGREELRSAIRLVQELLLDLEGGTVVHGRVWLFERRR
jgi:hypothetical protein